MSSAYLNDGSVLLSISEAAKYCSISQVWLRALCNAQKVKSYRFGNGWRRFKRRDLDEYMGIEEEEDASHGNGERLDCVLLRISSESQNRKSGPGAKNGSSMDNQRAMLKDWICNNEKYGPDVWENAVRVERVCSGLMHSDKKMVQLVTDLLAGKYKRLFVKNESRLMRWGKELFFQVAKAGNCEIIFTHKKEEQSDREDLVTSLLDIVTVFANRHSSSLAAEATRIPIDAEFVQEAVRLTSAGFSTRRIAQVFKEAGHLDKHGNPYTRHILYKAIQKSSEVVAALNGDVIEPGSFDEWFGMRVRITSSSKCRLDHVKLKSEYESWCAENGHCSIGNTKIVRILKA